jgi:hypothetical protein
VFVCPVGCYVKASLSAIDIDGSVHTTTASAAAAVWYSSWLFTVKLNILLSCVKEGSNLLSELVESFNPRDRVQTIHEKNDGCHCTQHGQYSNSIF